MREDGSANLRDKVVGIYVKAGFPANPEASGSRDETLKAICMTACMAPEAGLPLLAAWSLITRQTMRFWPCRRSANRCARLQLLKM